VLFDWDNTLVENWRSIQAALNEALKDAGRAPFDMEQVMFQARHSPREIFPALFGDEAERARAIFYEHFNAHHLAGLSIMPGAEALLDLLAEKTVPLGIVSNKKGDFLRREIAHLGWENRFVTIVGAQDASADKPDPAPIYLALEQGNISRGSDVWLVGDTDIDMRAAVAAGCLPVLVGEGPFDPSLFTDATPALRCRTCVDLAGFILQDPDTICVINGIDGQH
jgi:phosphoglycolate phosphatase